MCVRSQWLPAEKWFLLSPLVDKVWPQLLRVVWAALYACCQLAVELISGLPLWLADPIRLWKPAWLDWHTPSNPASNRPWPYTEVWLLRTSQSRAGQPFLNNPNKDLWGFFFSLPLSAGLQEFYIPFSVWGYQALVLLYIVLVFFFGFFVHREESCLFVSTADTYASFFFEKSWTKNAVIVLNNNSGEAFIAFNDKTSGTEPLSFWASQRTIMHLRNKLGCQNV